jgi:CRISPR/Cas system-associated protein endoribonuclease Cas2
LAQSSCTFPSKGYFSNKTKLHQLLEHDFVHAKISKSYSASHAHIKEAIYSVHDPDEATKKQLHLTDKQQDKLAVILRKHSIFLWSHWLLQHQAQIPHQT